MPENPTQLSKALRILEAARRRRPDLGKDALLQDLIAQLIAARERARMSQADVAAHMFTTPSVVSRLEAGRHTRPTLRTIQRYARAVRCRVEIRITADRIVPLTALCR